jgi:hypothetical protein
MNLRIGHHAASPLHRMALCSVSELYCLYAIAQLKTESLTNPLSFLLSQSEKARRIVRLH